MQLNVRELEQLVAIRCKGLQHELDVLQVKYNQNLELFKVLERNYTERGKALEAATKGVQLGQWISVSDLHYQIGYSDGVIMCPLKFTAASGADRVRFFHGETGALDTSSGQPEWR